jgi:hypothetical protein
VEALGLSLVAAPRGTWFELFVTTEVSDDAGLDYLHCHELALWADASFGAASRAEADVWWLPLQSRHDGEGGRERVVAKVTAATVRHLSDAAASGGRICDDAFTLTAAQKSALREFLGAVEPEAFGAADGQPLVVQPPRAKIGVPECDEYVTKYERCIQEHAPEAVRVERRGEGTG